MIGHRVFLEESIKLIELDYDKISGEAENNESTLIVIREDIFSNDLEELNLSLTAFYYTKMSDNMMIDNSIKTRPFWYKEVKKDKNSCNNAKEAREKALCELETLCRKLNITGTKILNNLTE